MPRSTRLHRLHAADKPSPVDAIRARLLEQKHAQCLFSEVLPNGVLVQGIVGSDETEKKHEQFFSALVVRHRQQKRHITNQRKQSDRTWPIHR